MDVILHIGMPKCGSTALQMHLSQNRAALRRSGVLYPRLASMDHAHHLLMPIFSVRGWSGHRAQFGEDLLGGALREWDSLLDQVRKVWPAKLVLSTESLFSTFKPEGVDRFASLLRSLSDSFTIVAYVREPSRYYRSWLMERAKKSSIVPPLRPVRYRMPIKQFADALGARTVVRAFDRALLHRGDIVADFFHHVLGMELPETAAVQDFNVSMGPEAAALFQAHMAASMPGATWAPGLEGSRIIRQLLAIEVSLGRSGTALRPEIAEAVTYSSKDLPWLRDRFGIVFNDVDYDRFRSYKKPAELVVNCLEDAFRLDHDYEARLVQALREAGLGLSRQVSPAAS